MNRLHAFVLMVSCSLEILALISMNAIVSVQGLAHGTYKSATPRHVINSFSEPLR